MKWERASITVRICFGFFGVVGLLGAWGLVSNWDIVEKQPSDTKMYLLLAAVGVLIFLWVAIVGRVPDIRNVSSRDKS
jgi:hypothetical protein